MYEMRRDRNPVIPEFLSCCPGTVYLHPVTGRSTGSKGEAFDVESLSAASFNHGTVRKKQYTLHLDPQGPKS